MKRIPLRNREGKVVRYAIIDDELFEKLNKYTWSVDGSGYPQTMQKTEKGWRPVRMHRVIFGLVGRESADHKNQNKLDHRLSNLRKCSSGENNRNRGKNKNNKSGYKGVHYNHSRKKFQAYIMMNRRHIYAGSFVTAKEAALAYDKAAKIHHGEFAKLNFPKK